MPGRGVTDGTVGRAPPVGNDGRDPATGGDGRVVGVGMAGRLMPGRCTPPKLGRCMGWGRATLGMAGRV